MKLSISPTPSVIGTLIPVSVNPLGIFACELLTVDPPELVSVSCSVCVLPTCTFPKLKLAGLATSDPAVTPFPERGTLSVEFEASLTTDRLPLAEPPDCGLNFTLKLAL